MQTNQTSPVSSCNELSLSSVLKTRTPHTYLLYRLLLARIAAKREVSNDILRWKLQQLELLYTDTIGHMPPQSLTEIYNLIATSNSSNSSVERDILTLKL
jgi:hypothetical protein